MKFLRRIKAARAENILEMRRSGKNYVSIKSMIKSKTTKRSGANILHVWQIPGYQKEPTRTKAGEEDQWEKMEG